MNPNKTRRKVMIFVFTISIKARIDYPNRTDQFGDTVERSIDIEDTDERSAFIAGWEDLKRVQGDNPTAEFVSFSKKK